MPVAPVVFPKDLPPLGDRYNETEMNFRSEQYERLRMSGEHISGPLGQRWPDEAVVPMTPTAYAAEMAYDAKCRANNGGLSDAPDDGGLKAVSSSPVRFG